jgi:hypothetical protein
MTRTTRGYEVCMRQDTRKGNGEYFAVIPHAYTGRNGERYYMALGSSDVAWVELSPSYLTRCTRTTEEYPEWLKRAIDRQMGYILNTVPRLGA